MNTMWGDWNIKEKRCSIKESMRPEEISVGAQVQNAVVIITCQGIFFFANFNI